MASVWYRCHTGCMDNNDDRFKFNISSTTPAKSKPKGLICLLLIYISRSMISLKEGGLCIHGMTATTATMPTPTQTTISCISWTTKSCKPTPTLVCSPFEETSIDIQSSFAAVVLLKKQQSKGPFTLNLHWVEWNERTHCCHGGAGRTHDLLVCLSTPECPNHDDSWCIHHWASGWRCHRQSGSAARQMRREDYWHPSYQLPLTQPASSPSPAIASSH